MVRTPGFDSNGHQFQRVLEHAPDGHRRLFRARLDSMIDMRHPLAVLASRMPRANIEASMAPLLAHKDRSGRVSLAHVLSPVADCSPRSFQARASPAVGACRLGPLCPTWAATRRRARGTGHQQRAAATQRRTPHAPRELPPHPQRRHARVGPHLNVAALRQLPESSPRARRPCSAGRFGVLSEAVCEERHKFSNFDSAGRATEQRAISTDALQLVCLPKAHNSMDAIDCC